MQCILFQFTASFSLSLSLMWESNSVWQQFHISDFYCFMEIPQTLPISLIMSFYNSMSIKQTPLLRKEVFGWWKVLHDLLWPKNNNDSWIIPHTLLIWKERNPQRWTLILRATQIALYLIIKWKRRFPNPTFSSCNRVFPRAQTENKWAETCVFHQSWHDRSTGSSLLTPGRISWSFASVCCLNMKYSCR